MRSLEENLASLEENLTLLNNIKGHLDEEDLNQTDVENYLETLDSIKQHADHIPSEASSPVYMEYQYYLDKQWLVGQLCGKLVQKSVVQKDHKIPKAVGSSDETKRANNASEGVSARKRLRTFEETDISRERPQDQFTGAIDEATRALGATSLMETEEPSTSSSSHNHQVLPKFKGKFC